MREVGNYLARVHLDHGNGMEIDETIISDQTLTEINTVRHQILGQCEFKDVTDTDMLSLPLTLTKAHVITWCLGELPINEFTKPYFKIMGLATDSTHADDVALLLKFEGTKYDTSLSGDDRAAADLLRRVITRGPQVYLKPAPQPEAVVSPVGATHAIVGTQPLSVATRADDHMDLPAEVSCLQSVPSRRGLSRAMRSDQPLASTTMPTTRATLLSVETVKGTKRSTTCERVVNTVKAGGDARSVCCGDRHAHPAG